MNPIAVIVDAVLNASRWLRNLLVGLATASAFVIVEIAGSLPERRQRPHGLRGWLQHRFRARQASLEEWRERLRILAADPRLEGVILMIGDLQAGMAALESLRQSLEAFRASGKRLIAYLVTSNLRSYYLASAAERLIAPESAELTLHGLRMEATFLRSALDQLGILPQFHHIAEYKSAANRFLYPTMPEPQREMLTTLLESMFEEIVAAIATARQLPTEAVRRAIDQGILSAAEARDRRLLDTVAFMDQVPAMLSNTGDPVSIHPWSQGRHRIRSPYRWRSLERQAIAVVQLLGTIVPGESHDLPLPFPLIGQLLAGHETITRALRRAERLPQVKAIIFHVDSPGGSAVASDLIWREVARIQAQKPIVVFMGNVAGSGGYYVTCGARHIVAGATTLTGSIGVIAGKVNLQGLFDKLGVHREILARGATASMPSAFAAYTEAEWVILRSWMEEIYHRFKARVAAGRKLSMEAVETIARGRVWTGRQALDHGLVDELGDFETAVKMAKDLAGISAEAAVSVMTVRPPRAIAVPSGPSARWHLGLCTAMRLLNEHALLLMPRGPFF
jgi:protease IV